jgi:hypothetical protein
MTMTIRNSLCTVLEKVDVFLYAASFSGYLTTTDLAVFQYRFPTRSHRTDITKGATHDTNPPGRLCFDNPGRRHLRP